MGRVKQAKSSSLTKDELRKHVATIHINGNLSLLERKLVNVLLLNAYDDLLLKTEHSIPLGVLSEAVGWEASNNHQKLKDAMDRLVGTVVTFDMMNDTKGGNWQKTGLVSGVGVENGVCTYSYHPWLAAKLANPEIYAIIDINVQQKFKSSYALALYENCLRFKRVGKTRNVPVDVWRKLLGAEAAMYDEFRHFSNHVIKAAIKEVNTQSNITIEAAYEKQGRKVIAIQFLVEEKAQAALPLEDDPRTTEAYKLLTDIGIGDKLATAWITKDPERALRSAKMAHDKNERGQLKGSPGGYARALFESDSALEPAKRVRHKAPEPTEPDLDAETRAAQTKASMRALTAEEKAALAAEFSQTHPAKSRYNAARDTFADAADLTAYRQFTRARAAEVIAARAQ